jgi:hypothetical protein
MSFFLSCFLNFLSLVFRNLTPIDLGVVIPVWILFSMHWNYWICGDQFGKVFWVVILLFFIPFFSLLHSRTPIKCIVDYLVHFLRSLRFCQSFFWVSQFGNFLLIIKITNCSSIISKLLLLLMPSNKFLFLIFNFFNYMISMWFFHSFSSLLNLPNSSFNILIIFLLRQTNIGKKFLGLRYHVIFPSGSHRALFNCKSHVECTLKRYIPCSFTYLLRRKLVGLLWLEGGCF